MSIDDKSERQAEFYAVQIGGDVTLSMVQVGIIGVAGALLAVQFKSGKAEYGIYISIALSLLIFFSIIKNLEMIVRMVRTIGDYISMDTVYIGTLLKMLGITYIAEFSSSICKDAGYQTIAGQIELFAKLSILVIGMPVMLAFMETIGEML